MHYRLCALVALCVSCSANESETSFRNPGGAGTGGSGIHLGAGGSSGASVSVPSGGGSDNGGAGGAVIITNLPPDFVASEIGGYKLGESLSGSAAGGGSGQGSGTTNCGNILLGVVRDMRGRSEADGHPDFEGPMYGNGITTGLVDTLLGSDRKPVYASKCEEGHPSPAPTCPYGAETSTKERFDQWYRYQEGVNKPFAVQFYFAPQPSGLFTFQSLFFYPLDNAGFGNSGTGKEGKQHNFSFTTEVHTKFQYQGGETFTFQGDDDVWIFINGKLAVDVGGLHPKETVTISLNALADQLGIVKGNVYDLELFHAERHTPESTFRIDTNLSFVNCGTLPPDVVK